MVERKVSFASVAETRTITGMGLGGGHRASKIIADPAIFRQTPAIEVVPDLAR